MQGFRYFNVFGKNEKDKKYILNAAHRENGQRNHIHEALKNAENTIKMWIETAKSLNREIPKAKGKLMFA